MNGFDEADLKSKAKRVSTVNIHDCAFSENFMINLFAGNILPKAKKIVTSRPRQFFEIPEEYRPQFTTYILGSDEDAQRSICKNICGDKDEKIFSFIQEHPDL